MPHRGSKDSRIIGAAYLLFVFLVLLSLILASVSFADSIYLKNGGVIEGVVVKKTDKKVVIKMRGGTMDFNLSEIKEIKEKAFSDGGTGGKTARPAKKSEYITYKGRRYTKERFEKLVKKRNLVKYKGKWMTEHEKTGLEIAANPANFKMQDVVKYAQATVVYINVDDVEQGSGVLIDPGGLILTCWHVVHDAKNIKVKLHEEDNEISARVNSLKREYDLALISMGGTDLPYLRLADPESIKAGDAVIAMGSPLGFTATSTSGIVSSVRPLKDFPGVDKLDLTRWQEQITLIQTDAAVNPGNSGGPLINIKGQIVGINSFGVSRIISEGLNFAIHAKEIKKNYSYYFK